MVCSYVPDDKPVQKCERNEDIFVQKNALKLLVAIKMALYVVSVENLDFLQNSLIIFLAIWTDSAITYSREYSQQWQLLQ